MDGDFRLGSWLVQPSLNAVCRNGTTVQLEPKVMGVLVCLAKSEGEPVSKERLLQSVWPDTFVGEGVLTRSVFELRRVFEDEAKEPRVIQTIPKRGYRLLAPVEWTDGHRAEATDSTPVQDPRRILRPTRLRWIWYALVLFSAVAVLGVSAKRYWATPPIRSLAVIPLLNLSGDPAQEYFADGTTGELIAAISHQAPGLRVISLTTSMLYKKTGKTLPEIARELNVDAVVEGSVHRSADRVRITAELIYARTDRNLWSETYDRSQRDALTVQEEVAASIANKIRYTVDPEQQTLPKTPKHVVSLKAHEAYLQGLHEDSLSSDVANHGGMTDAVREHRNRAIAFYRQALAQDPDYAPVYLALADPRDPDDVEAKARKAIELDPDLARAHVNLGAVLLTRDLNWQAAENEFRRAIEIDQNSVEAHQAYAYLLDAAGRMEEGWSEYLAAQDLDKGIDHMAGALYTRRQYAELIEVEKRALQTNPPGNNDDNAIAHKVLMVAYARTGRREESIDEFEKGLIAMDFGDVAEDMRSAYKRGGYEEALRAYLRGIKRRPDWNFHWLETYAHIELGEFDQAIAELPKLNKSKEDDEGLWSFVEENDGVTVFPSLANLRIEPMWDPLHSDPRFEELIQRLSFPH